MLGKDDGRFSDTITWYGFRWRGCEEGGAKERRGGGGGGGGGGKGGGGGGGGLRC